jgi:hypothetical protein
MATHKTCDGVSRRDCLKSGVLGGVGLTLSGYLQLANAGMVRQPKADAAIFINLAGGPSHLDTFDLKPDAPDTVRGSFKPMKTNVTGIEFSEHLPLLAILRGVTHTLAAHRLGSEYVNTGSRPLPSLQYPGYGAVLAKERPGPQDLPGFVAIPNTPQSAGYLGVKYAPLNTATTPRPGAPFGVRGISLPGGITVADVEKRQKLLKSLDKTFAGLESSSQLLEGLDRFSQQAYSIITSPRARQAFDISKESDSFAKPFGEDPFGLSCLLAVRLIASGVRFTTITLGGWDTHQNNFVSLKDKQLPKLDVGLSALFNGLEQKGLLQSTAVFVTGEFGRTPKINTRSPDGGRDHYPRCMFMLMAGGGVRGGQVIGESDATAAEPANEGFSPDDVAASFYYNLGIDHTKEFHTTTGRPIMIVRDGKVIDSLFA